MSREHTLGLANRLALSQETFPLTGGLERVFRAMREESLRADARRREGPHAWRHGRASVPL